MEIKHTIEILTKDIQDIEKLVRNLNNNPVPPSIELDLTLSKLRHVYELLLMIREDSISELDMDSLPESETQMTTAGSNVPGKNHPENKAAGVREVSAEKELPAEKAEDLTNHETATKEVADDRKQPLVKKESAEKKESVEKEESVEKGKPIADKQPAEKEQPEQNREAAILAEKFKQDRSLNERITGKESSDVSSKLSGSPIDSIARNIGINDRFQIIRELLNGDNEAYAQLIQSLDASANFNDAFHILESRFPDDLENESVQLLVNLSRRRFISSGNV